MNSRRTLCTLLACLTASLPACGSDTPAPPADTTAAAPTETTAPAVVKLDLLSMPIVRPDEANEMVIDAAAGLYRTLKNTHGGSGTLTTDWCKDPSKIDPNAVEILVGDTNRPASAALAAELEPGTFAIAATEHQLVIVGSDYFESARGARFFAEELLTGNTPGVELADGVVRIEPGFRYISEPGESVPGNILNSTDTFVAKASALGPIPRTGNYKTMQGGCVTEDYCYFALINTVDFPEEAVEAIIVKYDRETFKEVGRSKSIVLDHANDITYIPETNELYVVSCYVDSRRITVLDADTLESKGRKSLQGGNDGCYALEYNPLRQQFVSGCGRVNMNIYDKNLSHEKFVAGKGTTLVTQGICADDKYIYHVLYSSKSNEKEPDHVIFVFDWDGNFVSEVKLGIPKAYEPENISLVGDTFYIACNNADWTGGIVFTAKLEKK